MVWGLTMIIWIIQLLGLVIAIIGVFVSWPIGEKKIWIRWGVFGAFIVLAVILALALILDWATGGQPANP